METQEISVEKLLSIIEEKDRRIAELEQQVQWFIEQVRLSKHKQFGVSSEQTNTEQINLFNEAEATSEVAESEPQFTEVKTYYRKKRTRLTTDKLPEDLPVEIIEHKLTEKECVCPECGGELHTMGRETREELKIIPAKAVIYGMFAIFTHAGNVKEVQSILLLSRQTCQNLLSREDLHPLRQLPILRRRNS